MSFESFFLACFVDFVLACFVDFNKGSKLAVAWVASKISGFDKRLVSDYVFNLL